MTINELIEIAIIQLKKEGYRKSPSNTWSLVTGNLAVDDIDKMNQLELATYNLDIDWNDFKATWDEKFGKRKKSSRPVKTTSIYSEILDETEKAWKLATGKREHYRGRPQAHSVWVPKSIVSCDDTRSVFEMPVWLAIDKNLR